MRISFRPIIGLIIMAFTMMSGCVPHTTNTFDPARGLSLLEQSKGNAAEFQKKLNDEFVVDFNGDSISDPIFVQMHDTTNLIEYTLYNKYESTKKEFYTYTLPKFQPGQTGMTPSVGVYNSHTGDFSEVLMDLVILNALTGNGSNYYHTSYHTNPPPRTQTGYKYTSSQINNYKSRNQLYNNPNNSTNTKVYKPIKRDVVPPHIAPRKNTSFKNSYGTNGTRKNTNFNNNSTRSRSGSGSGTKSSPTKSPSTNRPSGGTKKR